MKNKIFDNIKLNISDEEIFKITKNKSEINLLKNKIKNIIKKWYPNTNYDLRYILIGIVDGWIMYD